MPAGGACSQPFDARDIARALHRPLVSNGQELELPTPQILSEKALAQSAGMIFLPMIIFSG